MNNLINCHKQHQPQWMTELRLECHDAIQPDSWDAPNVLGPQIDRDVSILNKMRGEQDSLGQPELPEFQAHQQQNG